MQGYALSSGTCDSSSLQSTQGRGETTHPTSSNSLRAAIGKRTPPIAAPNEAIPNASARLRLNQCPMTVKTGPKIMPQLIPTANPWHKSNCQYVLHSAISIVAATRNTLGVCDPFEVSHKETEEATNLKSNSVCLK